MDQLLEQVKRDYGALQYVAGVAFSWSPSRHTITYKTTIDAFADWSLLHELAHAVLRHRSYKTDFELLLLEVAAWEKAKELAINYDIKIDEDHIQDCIDTYRDWLHQRSTCPACSNTCLQRDATTYSCFNCGASWTVTASRFCRPYRLSSKQKTPPLIVAGTTFL